MKRETDRQTDRVRGLCVSSFSHKDTSPVGLGPFSYVMQEMWVCSLGREDPLEKEMATHSSILAWEIPWTEEPGGLESMGLQGNRTRL